MLSLFVVLAAIVVVARLIVKGIKPEPVLLLAGMALITMTGVFNWGAMLPAGVASTNVFLFEPFRYVESLLSLRVAKLGLMIMVLVGFADYMNHIGANGVIVSMTTKPLSNIQNKNILLFFAYVVSSVLQLAIPSATGLAVLLMGTLFPIMVGLGISKGASAAVIASSLAVSYTPTAVDAIRASEALQLDVMLYVTKYQAPTSLIAMIFIGLAHVFWQQYMDRKDAVLEEAIQDKPQQTTAPKYYAVLPLLPIGMSILFSPLVFKSVNLDIVTIVLIAMFISMSVEFFNRRSIKSVFDDFAVFSKSMGMAFHSVVLLLVAAGVFAQGIQATGAITFLINSANEVGLPSAVMTVLFALITLIAAVVMGSGNAPFLAFSELIPKIATMMGASGPAMLMPMQQASAMGRAMSPVSAVVIASTRGAGLSSFEVVKRTSVPVMVGFFIHISVVTLFY